MKRALLPRRAWLLASLWGVACPLPAAEPLRLADGDVVLMRHANAPGIGDPAAFKLGDCSTQRNLDAAGRAQAQGIGQALRLQTAQAGTTVAAVWSSQWCRTRETAALAMPGLRTQEVAAFNSFFDDASRAAAQTQTARDLLARWRGPGVLLVVTHQVNINALTGVSPASGAGVVVRGAGAELKVLGQWVAP